MNNEVKRISSSLENDIYLAYFIIGITDFFLISHYN